MVNDAHHLFVFQARIGAKLLARVLHGEEMAAQEAAGVDWKTL